MNKYENISISAALNEALNESIDWNNQEAEWSRLSSEFDSNFDDYGSKLIDIKTEETIGEIWDDSTIVLYNPEKYKDKIELLGDWSGCQLGSGEVRDKDENLLYSSRNLSNEAINESSKLNETILSDDDSYKIVRMEFEVSFSAETGEERNINSVSYEELEEVYEYIEDTFNSQTHKKDIGLGPVFRGNKYAIRKTDRTPRVYWDTEKQMEMDLDKYKD